MTLSQLHKFRSIQWEYDRMNYELGNMWKELTVAYFNVMFLYLPRRNWWKPRRI